MNFGLLYHSPPDTPYDADFVGNAPWQSVILNAQSDLGPVPDVWLPLEEVLTTHTDAVNTVYGYLSVGRMQGGLDAFADLRADSWFFNPDLREGVAQNRRADDDRYTTFDLRFWTQDVQNALQLQTGRMVAHGVTNLFLDDLDRASLNADAALEALGDPQDLGPTRVANMAMMQQVEALIASQPQVERVIANVSAYLFEDVIFGDDGQYSAEGAAATISFAQAIDGVLVENFISDAYGIGADYEGYHRALDRFVDAGLTVHVANSYGPDVDPDRILVHFAVAAERGYIPTASVLDENGRSYAGYNDWPLFDHATEGDDVLSGGVGNDLRRGGDGDDTILGHDGADTLWGGAGDDRILGGTDPALLRSFTDQGDSLYGGAGDDALFGGHGADYLRGDTGSDRLYGGNDEDRILGGTGDDLLDGSMGDDTLYGGDGADYLQGGDGDDALYGDTPGRDQNAADLRDEIYAGAGQDLLHGGDGNDHLRGDDGDDTLIGGRGTDEIFGGHGADVLTGQAWSDILSGGEGADFLNGGFGHDRLHGGSGADRFYHAGVAGHGSDWIQDFTAQEGDRLVFGRPAAADHFQLNLAVTDNAGDPSIAEAFIIHRPSGQILWALVDGAEQAEINVIVNGAGFDLLV